MENLSNLDQIEMPDIGPFLIVGEAQPSWQCLTAAEFLEGMTRRQQWSEPFCVFVMIDGRFVECKIEEP